MRLVEDHEVGDCDLLLRLGPPPHQAERPRRPQVAHRVRGVDDADHAVEVEARRRHLAPPQHLHERTRVGKPARLDQHVVKRQDRTGGHSAHRVSARRVAVSGKRDASLGAALSAALSGGGVGGVGAALAEPRHLEELVEHALELGAGRLAAAAHAPVLEHHDARAARRGGGRALLVDEMVVDRDGADLVLDDEDAVAVVARQDAVDQCRLAAAEEAGDYCDRNPCRGRLLRATASATAAAAAAELKGFLLNAPDPQPLHKVEEELSGKERAGDGYHVPPH